jgi:hypothetical protein
LPNFRGRGLFIPAEPKVESISRPQKYFRLLGAHPRKLVEERRHGPLKWL